jgi:chromosome segregation ATPase
LTVWERPDDAEPRSDTEAAEEELEASRERLAEAQREADRGLHKAAEIQRQIEAAEANLSRLREETRDLHLSTRETEHPSPNVGDAGREIRQEPHAGNATAGNENDAS